MIYAHLYGISKDDLDYILGTFPIVKRKDEAKYRVYRTRDLIMEYYEKYEDIGKNRSLPQLYIIIY